MKTLTVLKVDQPIGEFYVGAINYDDLLDIATVDVREFSNGNPGKIDGLQRELSPSRLKSLKEYVNLDYATFPTSIILAVDERCVELREMEDCKGVYQLEISAFEDKEEEIYVSVEKSAFVIDGQHRLAGLQNRDPELGPFEVNVSIFVGADMADQAEIFSRVNLAQTKVNKSLTYDLLDYAKETSPFKVAHDIAVALNLEKLEYEDGSTEPGPFYHRIKRLGKRTPGVDSETLAQATVVNGLLRHLPRQQEKERTKGIFGRTHEKEPNESWRRTIFVDFYRRNDTTSIYLTVSNYFEAVRDRWEDAWVSDEEGAILSRTTGYNALIRFLNDAFLEIVDKPRVVEYKEFAELLGNIDIDDAQLNKQNYLPGSSGASRLYKHLKQRKFSE